MKEKGWAITFGTQENCTFKGIHIGWYLTRKAAQDDFVRICGKDWKYWYKQGKRAVKIEITTL